MNTEEKYPKDNTKYWLTSENVIHCGICGHQASLTAGTIFHGTRKPLLLWFHIMWWVVAQKTGVSATNTCTTYKVRV